MAPKENTSLTQLDTGSPGFEIPERNDGISYTYDVGDPDREQGAIFLNTKGNMSVDGDDSPKKDISKFTRKVLADYIGIKTKHNYYPLDGDVSDKFSTVKITVEGTDAEGDKTPLVGNISNSKHYPKPNVEQGVEPTYAGSIENSPSLRAWRNSPLANDKIEYNPPKVNLTSLVKGKNYDFNLSGKKNGNELLQQVKKNDLGTIETYTTTVLNNNRFTGLGGFMSTTDRFAPFMGPTTDKVINTENLESVESARNKFNPPIYNPKYPNFNMGKMAQVGVALSTRASLEIGSNDFNHNPSSEPAEIEAIVPSLNQLGIASVDTTSLQPEDVLRNLSYDNEVENYVDISSKSWGTLNNVYDQFTGLSAIGMPALSIALTAAMIILFEVITLLVPSDGTSYRQYGGRFFSGRSYLPKTSDSIGDAIFSKIRWLLGIDPTIAPYKTALKTGINAFFGIDDSGGFLGGLISAASSASKSSLEYPGYSAAIARSVIRSIVNIIEAIKNIKGANLITGIKNFLSLIELIRSSKLISTMKLFSSLGDQLLLDRDEIVPKFNFGDEPVRKSMIDRLPDDGPGSSVSKNRLEQGGIMKLAWASNRARSSYLLPNSISALQPVMADLGAFQNGYLAKSDNSKTGYHFTSNARIPYDQTIEDFSVEVMEERIESDDSIPLYFQDLRTNEIISFHAFLDSFSDSFQPTYEQSDGFGRVEPVRIYKNTTRKIDISFHVISTSREDFDEMWIKINKLVTMVYPQYTEGRWVETKNGYKFTQPFSQMIGAAPMIRLRLGNLIAGNYSRFGLARLFGAGLNDTKFGNVSRPDSRNFAYVYGKYEKMISDAKSGKQPPDSDWYWTIKGGDVTKDPSTSGANLRGFTNLGPTWKVSKDPQYSQHIPVKVKMRMEGDKQGFVVIEPELPTATFLSHQGLKTPDIQGYVINRINARYSDIFGKSYVVSMEQLQLSAFTMNAIYNKVFGEAGGGNFGEYVQNLTAILDVEKNALAKSFKSTAGKGMAGFIDGLTFDWGGPSAKWEIDPDARAPQTCKVTLSFQPIHDITPGLDSQGYNRAPVYPVGQYMHGKDRLKPK